MSANQKYLSLRDSGVRAPSESSLSESLAFPLPQDFATQIYWWDAYKAACRADGVPRGRFLIPEVAEWLAGPFVAVN